MPRSYNANSRRRPFDRLKAKSKKTLRNMRNPRTLIRTGVTTSILATAGVGALSYNKTRKEIQRETGEVMYRNNPVEISRMELLVQNLKLERQKRLDELQKPLIESLSKVRADIAQIYVENGLMPAKDILPIVDSNGSLTANFTVPYAKDGVPLTLQEVFSFSQKVNTYIAKQQPRIKEIWTKSWADQAASNKNYDARIADAQQKLNTLQTIDQLGRRSEVQAIREHQNLAVTKDAAATAGIGLALTAVATGIAGWFQRRKIRTALAPVQQRVAPQQIAHTALPIQKPVQSSAVQAPQTERTFASPKSISSSQSDPNRREIKTAREKPRRLVEINRIEIVKKLGSFGVGELWAEGFADFCSGRKISTEKALEHIIEFRNGISILNGRDVHIRNPSTIIQLASEFAFGLRDKKSLKTFKE